MWGPPRPPPHRADAPARARLDDFGEPVVNHSTRVDNEKASVETKFQAMPVDSTREGSAPPVDLDRGRLEESAPTATGTQYHVGQGVDDLATHGQPRVGERGGRVGSRAELRQAGAARGGGRLPPDHGQLGLDLTLGRLELVFVQDLAPELVAGTVQGGLQLGLSLP